MNRLQFFKKQLVTTIGLHLANFVWAWPPHPQWKYPKSPIPGTCVSVPLSIYNLLDLSLVDLISFSLSIQWAPINGHPASITSIDTKVSFISFYHYFFLSCLLLFLLCPLDQSLVCAGFIFGLGWVWGWGLQGSRHFF